MRVSDLLRESVSIGGKLDLSDIGGDRFGLYKYLESAGFRSFTKIGNCTYHLVPTDRGTPSVLQVPLNSGGMSEINRTLAVYDEVEMYECVPVILSTKLPSDPSPRWIQWENLRPTNIAELTMKLNENLEWDISSGEYDSGVTQFGVPKRRMVPPRDIIDIVRRYGYGGGNLPDSVKPFYQGDGQLFHELKVLAEEGVDISKLADPQYWGKSRSGDFRIRYFRIR